METTHLIEVINLSKTYHMGTQQVHAVDNVTFSIDKGELVCIMGPSGSGKSTLMNLLGCLDGPTSGTYLLDGQEISNLSENRRAEIRNRHIGFVFQDFSLLPQATARENVELPLIYGPWHDRAQRAQHALELVGLAERWHHRPNELSGGQQQRVAIARALVTEPDVLMADEPTGNLDTTTGEEILQIFHQLHSQGKTVIIVTHDPQVSAHAERIIHLLDGKLVGDERNTPVHAAEAATGEAAP